MSTITNLYPFQLNDSHQLPAIGLGTFGMSGEEGIASLMTGLRNGYRLLDTAVGYRNEAEVGQAIRRSSVEASEIVVTTKLNASGHGYNEARRSIEQSRRTLGLDQIGLHLIHWPNPRLDKYVDIWRALIDARSDGEVRSIGVSNFNGDHLERLIDATAVVPAVNQIELHPHFPQEQARALHRKLGIQTQSWSPLGLGRQALLAELSVVAIATEHRVTPAQVVLRWHHQLGSLSIPRSSNAQRQAENINIGNFTLSEEEMNQISVLGHPDEPLYGRLWGGDPETEER